MSASELRPGDRAVIDGYSRREAVTVLRVTATQVVVPGRNRPRRFRRKNGREVGASGWHIDYIDTATPEELAAIERDDLAAWLTCVPKADWCGLGLGRLRELKAALRKPVAQQAAVTEEPARG